MTIGGRLCAGEQPGIVSTGLRLGSAEAAFLKREVSGPMSLVIVTGSIAPYTHRLYEAYAEASGEEVTVLGCAAIEPQRAWQISEAKHYKLEVLSGWRHHASYTSHAYFNPSVVSALRRLKPDTVILWGGFSPTMALAAGYARATGTPYGVATDGALATDPGETSRVHGLMRRLLVPSASFGVCASQASVELLARWGLSRERSVVVPIVVAWDGPAEIPGYDARPFDILFAGALNEHIKGALFFADVIDRCCQQGLKPKVRIVGDGPHRDELQARLAQSGVKAQFDGYLQADALPAAYGSAKLLMFPSRGDTWGLVANEAVLCGTPVIGSPHAVSSHELIEPFGVGLVSPLDVEAWAAAASDILSSPERWKQFSRNREDAVRWFSLEKSLAEFTRAVSFAGRSPGLAANVEQAI